MKKPYDGFLTKYPQLYTEGLLYEVPEGWMHVLDDLSRKLVALLNKYKAAIVVHQVKEKVGELRFYYSTNLADDEPRQAIVNEFHCELDKIIDKAEAASRSTCQVCGRPAKLRNYGGWFATICDACNEKRNDQ